MSPSPPKPRGGEHKDEAVAWVEEGVELGSYLKSVSFRDAKDEGGHQPTKRPGMLGSKESVDSTASALQEQLSRVIHYPYIPSIEWARKYTKADAFSDLIAGITVSVMLVPSAMADALLAHLPPVFGLYTGLLSPFVYALLGTSGQLNVGPVSLVSLFLPQMANSVGIGTDDVAAMSKLAVTSALLVGVIQVVMGVFKMGRLLNYVSHSVMAGFTTACGIYIGITQVGNLLGFKTPHKEYNYESMRYILEHVSQRTQKWSAIIGILSVLFLLVFKTLKVRYPPTSARLRSPGYKAFYALASIAAIVVVVVTTLFSRALVQHGAAVRVVGVVEGGLVESFALPPFELKAYQNLLSPAFLIALLCYIESYSVANKFAQKQGYEIDPSQELVALGASSIVTAFCSGYPPGGSFSRTAVAAEAGSKTPFMNVVAGVVVMLVLVCFTKQLYYVPKAALAAIIEVAIGKLIDWREFVHAWRVDKGDFLVMVFTASTTLFVTVELGLAVGLAMSFILLVNNLGEIQTSMMGSVLESDKADDDGQPKQMVFRALSMCSQAEEVESVKVVRPTFHLFFANSAAFKEQMVCILLNSPDLSYLIIDCIGISSIDLSGLKALDELQVIAYKRDVTLLLANVHGRVKRKMEAAGMLEKFGGDGQATRAVEQVFQSRASFAAVKRSSSFLTLPGDDEGED